MGSMLMTRCSWSEVDPKRPTALESEWGSAIGGIELGPG